MSRSRAASSWASAPAPGDEVPPPDFCPTAIAEVVRLGRLSEPGCTVVGRSRAVGPYGRAREAQLLEMAHDDLRRLRFRHVAEDGTETGPITWTTRRSDLVLCASPAGAAPSCTDRIPVDYERTETVFENIRRVTRFSARIAFSRDAIVVTRASGVVPRALRSSLGRYRWTQRGAWTR